jgi:hypothetical protein
VAIGIEGGRLLGQPGQEGGLGDGEVRGRAADSRRGLAASAPGQLVAVGRDAQVEGEDLGLVLPVLEAERRDHLRRLAAAVAGGG